MIFCDQMEGFISSTTLQIFAWTLEQLVGEGWLIDELAFDLHESDLSDDYKILTSYETRWLDDGRTTSFVRARPPIGQSLDHLS